MTISSGTRLGPYEVISPIGAGGMGEVFRARDSRLERDVAIKVLPSHFASDPSLKARFQREAKSISQLNHPHICTLYDIGHDNGTDYLVMELLEGESLADRVASGPLPIADVLRYGAQVAGALDRAHRAGITHRDLKPGNVMLTRSGAKLLDFGLAKTANAFTASQGGSKAETVGPTVQKPLTSEGTILGTFQYMAPEQLEGLEADHRTDIFALGCVLYEMATGRRAFEGQTRTSLIAAIVGGTPRPLKELQPLSPPALEHVIERCLRKDPEERWQSARDIAQELTWIAEAGTAMTAAAIPHRRRGVLYSASALAVVAAAAAGFVVATYTRDADSGEIVRASISIPDGVRFSPAGGVDDAVVLSPDGRAIAFTATNAEGRKMLWLRQIGELNLVALAGTEEARHPFWSHDSRSIAFFAGGKLKRIGIDGSPPVTICDAGSNPLRGSWNEEGTILFSPASGGAIHRVSASGGRPVPVTTLDRASGETTHRWAHFLPGGRSFLYTAASHDLPRNSEVNAVYASTLGSPQRKLILRARSPVHYVDGQLIFTRNETLFAQKFDARDFQMEGQPTALVKGVHEFTESFFSSFSISNADRLVYVSAGPAKTSQLIQIDGRGNQIAVIRDVRPTYPTAALSPAGDKVIVSVDDPSSGEDLWLHDLRRGTSTRLTVGESATDPVWSPDGKRMAYVREKDRSFYVRAVEGNTPAEIVWSHKNWGGPASWSPDSRYLSFWRFDPDSPNGYDALILPLTGERKAIPVAATAADEFAGRFSPDSRWLTYHSSESGRQEVYVVSVPDLQRRQQISVNGGTNGVWNGSKEIWYRQPDGTWVAVTLDQTEDAMEVSSPRPLFRDPRVIYLLGAARDDRIVAARENAAEGRPEIVLVDGWKTLLERARD